MDEKDYESYTPHTEDSTEEGDESKELHGAQQYPNTPCTQGSSTTDPLTPNTASTPASLSVTDDTDVSHFSISLDSGVESPQGFALPSSHIQDIVARARTNKQKASAASKAADHTNKEKLRRERIKESCDQLRVLLPYIRGRKTDMASVLEMCVEYLRIVNAFMPQTLQEQIVDILSKETAQAAATGKGKGKKSATLSPKQEITQQISGKGICHGQAILSKETAQAAATGKGKGKKSATLSPKQEITQQINGALQNNASFSDKSSEQLMLTCTDGVISCDVNNNHTEEKITKRMRLQDGSGVASRFEQQNEHTGSGTSHTDTISTYSYHGNQLGGIHVEEQQGYNRLYGDGYNTAQQIYNNYTNNKNLQLESDYLRPTYLDSYHYYPGIINAPVPQNRMYSTTEYVNPNAVLQTLPYSNVLVKQPIAGNMKTDVYCTANTADQRKEEDATGTL